MVRTLAKPRYATASLTVRMCRRTPVAAELTTRSTAAPTTGSDETISPTLRALEPVAFSSRRIDSTALGSGGICASPLTTSSISPGPGSAASAGRARLPSGIMSVGEVDDHDGYGERAVVHDTKPLRSLRFDRHLSSVRLGYHRRIDDAGAGWGYRSCAGWHGQVCSLARAYWVGRRPRANEFAHATQFIP